MKTSFVLILALLIALDARAQTSPAKPAAKPPTRPTADSSTLPIQKTVENYLRNLYALGPKYHVKVGPLADAPVAGFYEVPIEVSLDDQSDSATVYVSKDGRYIFRGDLQDMSADPLAAVRAKIRLDGSPSKGPSNARVTVVEYADFQCPTCRQLHGVLREIEPQYPLVRFVYKDFPLTQVHPWAMTAAIAGRCAFQQSPEAFWKVHDLIYDGQDFISPENVWGKMLDFAARVGLDSAAFKTCLASKDTSEALTRSIEEAKDLKIANTPTVFVNGRRMIGADRQILEQYILFELAAIAAQASR